MPFTGIIITGTSCAGKSTITQILVKDSKQNNLIFEQVQAVTTRDRRPDDTCYEYVDDEAFKVLQQNRLLLTDTVYRGQHYGIKSSDYQHIINKHHIPILVVTPSSAADLLSSCHSTYMCFFIDSPDDVLLDRKAIRDGTELTKRPKKDFLNQCKSDRKYQDNAHYILDNSNSASSASLIRLLWEHQESSGVLSAKWIKQLIGSGVLLRNASTEMIKGASYDLCLGDEYYYNGKIQHLTPANSFLTIEPYDYAIVSCKETAWIPRDIVGKFGLSVGLFCQGIILSNGPQIDPGFRGTLFCLLFNTSNRAVHLKRGVHYATIEFNKMLGCAEPYKGRYQGKESIIDYIPSNAMHGAINELKKEVESLKNANRIMQNIYLGVVALMFTIISILLVLK